MDSFKLPLHPTKHLNAWSNFSQYIHTFMIILKRIKKNKKIHSSGSDSLESIYKLALDIKSLIIFAKSYLDYLTRYIVRVYLTDIQNDKGRGLKSRSFDSHVRQLKNQTFETDNEMFQNYRDYILKNESKIFFKIINIRDKLITHQELNVEESWTYFESEDKFSVHLSREIPVGPISDDLKEELILLLSKFKVIRHTLRGNFNFFFYDKLLEKIELRDGHFEIEDRAEIADCRIKLGVAINEERIIKMLYDFCKGLCNIFKIEKDLYIEKNLRNI